MKLLLASFAILVATVAAAEARGGHGAVAHALSGTATYYGGSDGHCGGRTASGLRFDCTAMTVAHRTLPFGTKLNVCSAKGCAEVVVTDRGPFTGAFIDLSPAVAKALGGLSTHHGVTATVVEMGTGSVSVARASSPAPAQQAFALFDGFGQQPQPARAVRKGVQPAFPLFAQAENPMRPASLFAGAQARVVPATRHHHRRRH